VLIMTNLAVQLADTVKSFGVKAVYGEPQDIEGTTFVPVALVAYGFGAGEGEGPDGEGNGGGGGGGGYTLPIGAYVGDSLGVRFQPNIIAVLTVGIPFVYAVGTALSRIIRALKK
jgi:uncharacterized spore protein YtfJ